MNLKIIFGIFLPLVVIIALTVLASLNVGFQVKTVYLSSLNTTSVTEGSQIKDEIYLGNIEISNDYFLPKRYDLPSLMACLRDKEGGKPLVYAGQISYRGGNAIAQNTKPSPPIYNNVLSQSIEISTNDKKSISIFLSPDYNFRYKKYFELINQYGEYDELILVKSSNSYNRCQTLSSKEQKESIHISFNLTGDSSSCPVPVSGILGLGLQFDGQSDYIKMLGNAFPTSNSPRTIAAWVYQDDISSRSYILGYGGDNGNSEFRISLNEFVPGQFSLETCGAGWHSNVTLKPGTWYHLAVVYNGFNDPQLFVNAVDYGISGEWGRPSIITENGNENVGTRGSCDGDYFFKGRVDEVGIWDRALTLSELFDLYSHSKKAEDLSNNILSLHFENSNGNTFIDSSSFGNDAKCI